MTLEQFGKELQDARQEKNISLMDISIETRISVKFLEAIEQGQFHLLPQTYIRAFLREYASFIGIDNDEIMKRYALARGESAHAQPGIPVDQHAVSAVAQNRSAILTQRQRQAVIAGLAALAFVLVLLLAHIGKKHEPITRETEVPFDKVVRETEAASIPQTPAAAPQTTTDSVPGVPQKTDSLQLEMVTTDSVWINLLIDNHIAEDHLYGPNKHRRWTARNQFIITMGNAGGATFTLNGKDLGALGKRGAVVRHTVITEALLHQ
ncbi:MAG TPA: helix-turn-helix domain-containing protein [Bacteroidota bacterium]|nr:helix-turn-helix domain-containing protein [Bacteroidota bacterium]